MDYWWFRNRNVMDMELTRVADVECGLRFYEDKTYDDIA